MALAEYKAKRTKSTPEPFGSSEKSKKKKAKKIFVVQKHAASHLHYDFRLEVEGVLKSWAVPKGPSMNPAEKHLAVMVEDHPYEYHDFEGTIPKGSYGGGTVMVWDEGTYIPVDEKGQEADERFLLDGIKMGKFSFILYGSKLKGRFSMVRLRNNKESAKENWLIFKANDEHVMTENILDQDLSVLTNRSMDEITDNHPPKKNVKKKPAETKKSLSKKKIIEPLPKRIEPMLAFLTDKAFDSLNWLYETKWDGFRCLAEVEYDTAELYSRSFQSFTSRFKPILEELKLLQVKAIFDGEVVVIENGKSSFQALQNYQRTGKGDLRYYIFDFLHFEGHDLRDLPLIKRKELLRKLLPPKKNSCLQFSKHVLEKGRKAFADAEKKGLEGIIAKEIHSPYCSKRSRDWLKIKTHARQEAIICGFTEPKGSRKKFGALILGIYREGELHYAGHVGGGFDQNSLADLSQKLTPFITSQCPFRKVPKTNTPVTWVKPKLICEVSFHEWTADNRMRQPIYKGLRSDKEAKEVRKETPITVEEQVSKKKGQISSKQDEPALTNLDKVFWPLEGYTKGDLIEYYRKMTNYILPYLKDRPESLRRYPNGIDAEGFFQKNIDSHFPEWLTTYPVKHKEETRNYMLIQDMKTLLYAVNLGCIDFNPFSSRIANLENPDYIIIDLDPEAIPFEAVIETAKMVHKVLEGYSIPSFCKTSGATGMHILIPAAAKYSFEQVKMFAEIICNIVHAQLPDITSVERSPSKRQKKVYLDFLQNNFGQTIACPYSVRPKLHAPVSTPLEWKEVKKGLVPHDFTIKNILKRVEAKGDLFKPVLGKGIDLIKALKAIKKQ